MSHLQPLETESVKRVKNDVSVTLKAILLALYSKYNLWLLALNIIY